MTFEEYGISISFFSREFLDFKLTNSYKKLQSEKLLYLELKIWEISDL